MIRPAAAAAAAAAGYGAAAAASGRAGYGLPASAKFGPERAISGSRAALSLWSELAELAGGQLRRLSPPRHCAISAA